MFNKTRRKIIITVVASLMALLLVTLTTIYLSNRFVLRRESEEMLKSYSQRFNLNTQQGEMFDDKQGVFDPQGQTDTPLGPPDDREPMRNEPQFKLSTFYSVAFSESGDVIGVNSGNKSMQSEESLIELAKKILDGKKNSGSIGNIYYLVTVRDEYTLVAMIDSTINEKNQQTLFIEMLVIGAVALVILFIISIFISRRIVKPLEENDDKQKRFVSDAGHELKTPIAVISANSELLKRQIGQNEWLNNIDYENERMSELVKQLLTLSKAEKGELPKETLDYSKLVEGEVLPIETLAFEKGKQINQKIEQSVMVDGNANQLHQLVSILLDNALSHGTGQTIELILKKEKHNALLSVSNESDQIDSEQLSHLFDRFYRTDESRQDNNSHYGLGLSIAKAITESHKGRITADYKNGFVTFTVTIPVKK